MKRYRLAVCKGPDCRINGAEKVFAEAREKVAQAGLGQLCEVYRGGCYGLCELGPNVVVREDAPGRKRDPFSREDFQLMGWDGEVHYPGMTPEKIAEVIREHIAQDRPVEALRGSAEDVDPAA
jgi:(2Fe-2S) ferredoxin